MRLFFCYARVDKPMCIQIAEKLTIHEVWYDQRLYVGQHWWREILHRLDWCDVFIYLLSPESINSKYCRDEFRIARDSNRHIIPIMISPPETTPLPDELGELHYADFSKGVTSEAITSLYNALTLIEREGAFNHSPVRVNQPTEPPPRDLTEIIAEAAEALDDERYDHAIHIMERYKDAFAQAPLLPYDEIIMEAKRRLDRQIREREAERQYRPIVQLVKYEVTRDFGLKAFRQFRKNFADYDPENLAVYLPNQTGQPPKKIRYTLPMLKWRRIPAPHDDSGISPQMDEFYMSQFAITNEQFARFVTAPDGYLQTRWWDFSLEAHKWRQKNIPIVAAETPSNHPRTNVNWYQAMAFCRWLSHKMGLTVTLPTSAQWQRAARGDEQRIYPWGNKFLRDCANTKESRLGSTTPVDAYPQGVSVYNVYGLSGNCWEWCLHAAPTNSDKHEGENVRAIHGGSYISSGDRARIDFHYNLNPEYLYTSIGFRVVLLR